MDLHSDHPWSLVKNGLLGTYPPLRTDAQCQVLVIGGGVSGALVSARLVERGFDVLMIDKREFGMGSTCASTSLVLYELDAHLVDLREKLGLDKADRAYKAAHRVLQIMPELVDKAGGASECDYVKKKSFYLANSEAETLLLQREAAARRELGINCRVMDACEIAERFPFQAPAGILSEEAAALDLYRFTHGLIRYAVNLGLRAFDRTSVESIEERSDYVKACTDRGALIKADAIVFAAGYESQNYIRKNVAKNMSTYALASEPLEGKKEWWEDVHIWETSRPYIYMAVTPDRRVLLGGEDEPFTTAEARDRLLPGKTEKLVGRFKSMFPDIPLEPAFCWTGTFAETTDALPRIGRTDEWKRALFALGYGGNGITFSVLAAEIIAGELAGEPVNWADVFQFS